MSKAKPKQTAAPAKVRQLPSGGGEFVRTRDGGVEASTASEKPVKGAKK